METTDFTWAHSLTVAFEQFWVQAGVLYCSEFPKYVSRWVVVLVIYGDLLFWWRVQGTSTLEIISKAAIKEIILIATKWFLQQASTVFPITQ